MPLILSINSTYLFGLLTICSEGLELAFMWYFFESFVICHISFQNKTESYWYDSLSYVNLDMNRIHSDESNLAHELRVSNHYLCPLCVGSHFSFVILIYDLNQKFVYDVSMSLCFCAYHLFLLKFAYFIRISS
jgi:hypothetical protein